MTTFTVTRLSASGRTVTYPEIEVDNTLLEMAAHAVLFVYCYRAFRGNGMSWSEAAGAATRAIKEGI